MECLGRVPRPLHLSTIPRCPPSISRQNRSSFSFLPRSSLLDSSLAVYGRRCFAPRAASTPLEPCRGKALEGTLSSLLRPVPLILTMGAAIFLARLHKPSLALALSSFPASPTMQYDAEKSATVSMEDSSAILTEEGKERTLEEYLDSYPEDARALRALMKLKIQARKPAEAIAIVDRLIAVAPSDRGLPLLRAHLLNQSGDADAAKQLFEDMLQRDPLLPEAYHGLVMAASQSESESDLVNILDRIMGAIELCKRERRKEEARDFRLLVAQVKVIQGDYSEALKVYQELVKEEPRDFRPYLCQGIIYTQLRKKDEADRQFQKYRRLVPKGHPYANCFDGNMVAGDVFSQLKGGRRTSVSRN